MVPMPVPLPLALLLSLVVPEGRSAAEIPARSRIDAVTVHRSSARVTRLARVELPSGDARVVLAGLPDELEDDSLRVEGQGSARARVFGVSVERVNRAEAQAGEARAAEAHLERLQDEDRALEDRARVAQGRQKFVESLRSTYADERARNLAVRGVSSKEWADLAGFVEAQLASAAAEVRRSEVGRRELARRIEAARADLEKVRAKRGSSTKSVVVEVRADQAGAFDLAVTYAVPSASWEPVWDARLLPGSGDAGKVELDLIGSVRNRSGEDWSGVRLSVSTAEPGRRLFVPRLDPRFLQRYSPPVLLGALGGRAKAVRAEAPAPAATQASTAEAADRVAEAKVEVEVARATVQEGLLAATFTAPRRETVDGAGQARRVALQRYSLPAAVTRTAAPRIDPAAFLTARMVNETGVPLLPGSASVYLGEEFVGRAPLAFTAPGGELELAFGADPRVEVERRVLERRHETAGLVSKDDVWRYQARITVKNRWTTPVTVKLLDLVPVSREEAIEVKVLEGTTPAKDDPERPGIRVHELTLGARQEQVVEIRYQVRFPRGFPVSGLE